MIVDESFELTAEVDSNHLLQAEVPKTVSPGKVRLILLVPDEDDAGREWASGISHEWADELSDPREDIYSLDDGENTKSPKLKMA